ncbi:hypothetical protein AYI69_g8509 [Smittium culicis]|uniref:Uncharacterized protein n=1 Tax=Smittium culicis TaxID=133412 RepID=A0A1R1XJ96_9FUNG|nr:hypothetical protein AYI69_g8509 [Smittium culicis]
MSKLNYNSKASSLSLIHQELNKGSNYNMDLQLAQDSPKKLIASHKDINSTTFLNKNISPTALDIHNSNDLALYEGSTGLTKSEDNNDLTISDKSIDITTGEDISVLLYNLGTQKQNENKIESKSPFFQRKKKSTSIKMIQYTNIKPKSNLNSREISVNNLSQIQAKTTNENSSSMGRYKSSNSLDFLNYNKVYSIGLSEEKSNETNISIDFNSEIEIMNKKNENCISNIQEANINKNQSKESGSPMWIRKSKRLKKSPLKTNKLSDLECSSIKSSPNTKDGDDLSNELKFNVKASSREQEKNSSIIPIITENSNIDSGVNKSTAEKLKTSHISKADIKGKTVSCEAHTSANSNSDEGMIEVCVDLENIQHILSDNTHEKINSMESNASLVGSEPTKGLEKNSPVIQVLNETPKNIKKNLSSKTDSTKSSKRRKRHSTFHRPKPSKSLGEMINKLGKDQKSETGNGEILESKIITSKKDNSLKSTPKTDSSRKVEQVQSTRSGRKVKSPGNWWQRGLETPSKSKDDTTTRIKYIWGEVGVVRKKD